MQTNKNGVHYCVQYSQVQLHACTYVNITQVSELPKLTSCTKLHSTTTPQLSTSSVGT